jgi:hypothetical protein
LWSESNEPLCGECWRLQEGLKDEE